MNWGDELCGVKVTPESWLGGVVGFPGHRWYRVKDDVQCGDDEYFLSAIWVGPLKDSDTGEVYHDEDGEEVYAPDPIFPPRGWAGKTDAELWNEVFNPVTYPLRIAYGYSWELAFDIYDATHGRYPLRLLCGTIERGEEYHDCAVDYEELRDPAALILALQNAQVLARRLA